MLSEQSLPLIVKFILDTVSGKYLKIGVKVMRKWVNGLRVFVRGINGGHLYRPAPSPIIATSINRFLPANGRFFYR